MTIVALEVATVKLLMVVLAVILTCPCEFITKLFQLDWPAGERVLMLVEDELTLIVEVFGFQVKLPPAGVVHGVPVELIVHVPEPILTTLVVVPEVANSPIDTL